MLTTVFAHYSMFILVLLPLSAGKQLNMTLYAKLMQATGKNYTIENCHWGKCTDDDTSSCPTTDWCPFNWHVSAPRGSLHAEDFPRKTLHEGVVVIF